MNAHDGPQVMAIRFGDAVVHAGPETSTATRQLDALAIMGADLATDKVAARAVALALLLVTVTRVGLVGITWFVNSTVYASNTTAKKCYRCAAWRDNDGMVRLRLGSPVTTFVLPLPCRVK